MDLIAFYVLALLLIASALVVITNRNPVTSAVALAFNLVGIAGIYMVLDAQFIGLLQVIVYAGAIMVLILFVWVRWTLPRFRYDQLMNLGWKGLLPLSLANLAFTAILVVYGIVGH